MVEVVFRGLNATLLASRPLIFLTSQFSFDSWLYLLFFYWWSAYRYERDCLLVSDYFNRGLLSTLKSSFNLDAAGDEHRRLICPNSKLRDVCRSK